MDPQAPRLVGCRRQGGRNNGRGQRGDLYGEKAGVAFEGVRYVDRITLRDGKIIRQEVWNDLAESA